MNTMSLNIKHLGNQQPTNMILHLRLKTFLGILFLLFGLQNFSFGGAGPDWHEPTSLSVSGPGTVCQGGIAIVSSSVTYSPLICDNSGNTDTNIPVTYQWFSDTDATPGGGTIIGGATAATYSAPTAAPGSIYYYCRINWTSPGGTCSSGPLTSTNNALVTVNSPPTVSTNGGNQTIAACATSTVLTGNTPTSGTGTWTVAPAGPTFSPNANAPNATASGMTPGTNYTYTWTIANAPCTPSASNLTVTTSAGPGCWVYCNSTYSNQSLEYISNVSFNTLDNTTSGGNNNLLGSCTNVILGSTHQLSVSVFAGAGQAEHVFAYFDWNNDGDFADVGEFFDLGNTVGSGILTANITIPVGATLGNTRMRIIMEWDVNPAGPCDTGTYGETENYCVNIINCTMNTPVAGPNQNLASCATSTNFAGNTITNGTGSWSLVSGSGNITTPSSPTSAVTNLGPGANVFTWTGTPTVVGCPILSSNVTINTLNLPSIAIAGSNLGGCATSYTLGASAPSNGTGVWTCTSGCTGVTITTPSSPTSTVTGVPVGTTVLTWTVTGTTCPTASSTDQMSISVAAGVTTANAGPDQTGVCWNVSNPGIATLSGNTPSVGTGTWTVVTNTTGGTLNNATSPNATITGINATGTITLTWTISGIGCASTSTDNVTITTANCNGDEPCTALGLAVTTGACSYSTFSNSTMTYSTGMPEPGCSSMTGPDIWFAVTVPASGQVQLSGQTSQINPMISIYDGTCGSLQFSGCVNGAGTNAYPLTYAGAPGSVIYVRVNDQPGGPVTTQGTFGICAYEATTSTVSEVLPGVTTTVTCGQTLNFYDTGGLGGTTSTNTSQPPPAGNYSNNTGTTWKICPSDPTQYVSINFSQFLLENGFDKMIITSGTNNVVAQWTYNQGLGDIVTSQAAGECLTIYFQSDYSFTALGWAAVVSCTSTPVASQINNECVIQNCTGGCGKWICASGTYGTAAGAGSGIDEINEVTGGCWGSAGEIATSWFYFTTAAAGTMTFQFVPSNNGHNINFALYGPTTNGIPSCPTTTGDAPIRCSFATAGGINTGLASGETDLYDIATGNGLAAPLTVLAGQTYALAVDVYQNGQPPTQTTINFTGAALDCTPITLPITLGDFEGINQGDHNLLSWIVYSQMNNAYFTIERSVNGVDWEVVGTVEGAGTTQHTMFYSLTDLTPNFPVSYYRLKQTDMDGEFSLSEIISISTLNVKNEDFISPLFPNPSSQFVTFSFNGKDTKTPLNVKIVNQLGQNILDLTYMNLNKGMATNLPTFDLSEGMYQVVFTQGDNKQTQKLTIIR